MKRVVYTAIVMILIGALGASFSEIRRLKAKVGLISQHTFHDHQDVRQFVIRSQIAQAGEDAVVVVGDSITESALFPDEVCGHRIVNAGVGGATVNSYLRSIVKGIPRFRASMIIVALGTNDALASNGNFTPDYINFLDNINSYSDAILLAGLPSIGEQLDQQIRSIALNKGMQFIDIKTSKSNTIDGIHLSVEGYKPWMAAILGGMRRTLNCNE